MVKIVRNYTHDKCRDTSEMHFGELEPQLILAIRQYRLTN